MQRPPLQTVTRYSTRVTRKIFARFQSLLRSSIIYGYGNTTAQGTSNSAILNNNYVSLLSDRLSAHAYKHENGVTNEAIAIEWAAVAAW